LPNSITDYTGSYYHPGYGQIEISEADGVLRLDYLNIREHFVHENAHNFISQNTYYLGFFEGESLKFEREEEGDIVAVSVPFDYPHPIRFTRDRKMKICVFWCVE